MTKNDLIARIAYLEAKLPTEHELPEAAARAHDRAAELGAKAREASIRAGRATRTSTIVAKSAACGFFAGLFGKA